MNYRPLPFVVAFLAFAWPLCAEPEAQYDVLRGQLVSGRPEAQVPSALRFVASEGRSVVVRGDQFAESQLTDPRLAGSTWELEGNYLEDGSFEIIRLYTVKQGRRHRITYYCDICHIYTHEPGRCMCCQEDTVLQEIPVDERTSLGRPREARRKPAMAASTGTAGRAGLDIG